MIKIYGNNCVLASLKAKAPIIKLFIQDDKKYKFNNLIERLINDKIKYEIVSKQFLDKNFGAHHQGIALYREDYKAYDLDYIFNLDKKYKRILILDGVSDPHNFGAIIRSVDAFGFDAIILANDRSVPITEVVAHVSTGAIEYVPIIYVNSLNNAIKKIKDNDFWLVSTDANANALVKDISLDRNIALVIGSEGFGISKTVLKQSDYIVKIPMVGHVNSLNASVSAGIFLNMFMVDNI